MAPRTATWPWASWRRWHGAAASSYLRWCPGFRTNGRLRSEEHTSELQSQSNLVCRLLLEKNTEMRPRYPDCFRCSTAGCKPVFEICSTQLYARLLNAISPDKRIHPGESGTIPLVAVDVSD